MAPNSIVGKFVNDNNEEYLSTRVAQNLATFSRGLAKKIVSSGNAEDAAEALFTVTRSEIEVRKLADDIAACDVTFAHRVGSYTAEWPIPKLHTLFNAAVKSDEFAYKDITCELVKKNGEELKSLVFLNALESDVPTDSPSIQLCFEADMPILFQSLRIFPLLNLKKLANTRAWLKTLEPTAVPQTHSLLCISKLSSIFSVPQPVKLVAQHADIAFPPKIFVERNEAGIKLLSANGIACECVQTSLEQGVEVINMGIFAEPWEITYFAAEAASSGQFYALFMYRGLDKKFVFPFEMFESFIYVPEKFHFDLGHHQKTITIPRPTYKETPGWSRSFIVKNGLDNPGPHAKGCGNLADVVIDDDQAYFQGRPIIFGAERCSGTEFWSEPVLGTVCSVVEGSMAERLHTMVRSFRKEINVVCLELSETQKWPIVGAIEVGTGSPSRKPTYVNLTERTAVFRMSCLSFAIGMQYSDPIQVDAECGVYSIHVGGDVYATYALVHIKTKRGDETHLALTHVLRAPLCDTGIRVLCDTSKSFSLTIKGTLISFFFDDAKARGFKKKVPKTIVKDVLKRKSAILDELALFAIDETSIAVFSLDSYDDPETLLAAAKRRGGEAGDETSSFFNLLLRHREREAGKTKLAAMQTAAAEREEREAAEAAAAARERALLVKAERAGRAGRSVPVSRAAKKEAARTKKHATKEREETLATLRFREEKEERQRAFEEKQRREHEAAARRKAEAAEKKEAERRMRKALPALEEEFAPPVATNDLKSWTGEARSIANLPGELLLTSEKQEGDGATSVCAHSELCSAFEDTLHFSERVHERGTLS